MQGNSNGSRGSKRKSYYPQAKGEWKIRELMTGEELFFNQGQNLDLFKKGVISMTGTQNLLVAERLAGAKGTVLLCRNSLSFWSWFTERLGSRELVYRSSPPLWESVDGLELLGRGCWWRKYGLEYNGTEHFIISLLIYKCAYPHKITGTLGIDSSFYWRNGSWVSLLGRICRVARG